MLLVSVMVLRMILEPVNSACASCSVTLLMRVSSKLEREIEDGLVETLWADGVLYEGFDGVVWIGVLLFD